MTQALALREHLDRAGHVVACVLIGRSSSREIPSYFHKKIDAPVAYFDSPNFTMDSRLCAVQTGPTLWNTLCRTGQYWTSLQWIDTQIRYHNPDVIVNFFEPMSGLYSYICRPNLPVICLGHQYLFQHPDYAFPPGYSLQRRFLQAYIELTAARSTRRLALSFYPASEVPKKNLVVMPPLLRPALFLQADGHSEPFLLVYLLNSGYAEAILDWHRQHPEIMLHCFWDKTEVPEIVSHDSTLTFHRLNDSLFMSMMAKCSGLVCTAGFEAVCEATYLGKPVLAVPVEGHYEQYCNALDAMSAGVCVFSRTFEIDQLLPYVAKRYSPAPEFRRWVAGAEIAIVREIEDVVAHHSDASQQCVAA